MYPTVGSVRFEQNDPYLLELIFDGPGLNSVDADAHRLLAEVWDDIDDDDRVRAVLVRGAGRGLSSGGSFEMLEALTTDPATRERIKAEVRGTVVGMLGCSKPIVSAIHGPAVGAGLAVALLADISVAARSARILDGHTKLGVAAGDHAALCWPLLCGMAKAKYYLLTCDDLTGEMAAEIGLVSLAVDDDELASRSRQIAVSLAQGARRAISATKLALNSWYEVFQPSFEQSLAGEFEGFAQPEAAEGLRAIRERRAPRFVELSE
ncbi:MAG TPA: enoyl-CoA hydratase/isomerase family protein [Ilumatobacter sp.]|nr:enoyl-CoA hydratase/isomerase family protein [Ilumatobacter sp.]